MEGPGKWSALGPALTLGGPGLGRLIAKNVNMAL